MHRFFADENGVVNGAAALDALDAQHAVRVLRLTAGDEVELMDAGRRYAAAIEAAGPDGVRVRITRVLPSTEPRVRVTLFQGLPKAEKMELIVQKCTELGVYEVQPVAMERCVAQIKDKDAEKKRGLDAMMRQHGRYHELNYAQIPYQKTTVLRLEAEGFTVKRYRERTLPQGHAHGE